MRSFIKVFLCVLLYVPVTGNAQDVAHNLNDIVDLKGSSAEYELKERGYALENVDKSSRDIYQTWWNSRRGECVSVRLVDGRVRSVVKVPEGDCNRQGSSRGSSRKIPLSEFRGMYESEASSLLQDRDWKAVNQRTQGNMIYLYWYKERENRCLQMLVSNDKVLAVSETSTSKCNAGSDNYSSRSRGSSRDEGITLFDDCGYRGGEHTLGVGRYNVNEMGVGNDRLSALRVPPGYSVTLYTDSDFRGSSKTFTRDVSCLDNIGWNDRASSIRVSRGGGDDGVTLYKDCDYKGQKVTLRPGSYDVNRIGVGNDNLSCIEVPPGYTITLYEDANFRGDSKTFYEDIRCLNDEGWNDRASSVRIRKN